MRTLAIIPARGGSKRIPRKNVKYFCGKPMIAYAIELSLSSELFEQVVVSTDDDEIAELASKYGATVPFRRPPNLATDEATTDSVLVHAIAECEAKGAAFRQGCCIYPANPFLTKEDLAHGLRMLVDHKAASAFPVVKYDFPIEQAFSLDGVRPRAKWPEMLPLRSQQFVDHYHDAGMFYWFDVPKFSRAGKLFSNDCVAFAISSNRSQDINTPEDWTRAELKYRILQESIKL